MVTLGVGIVGSLALFCLFDQSQRHTREIEFSGMASAATDGIQAQIEQNLSALQSVAALYASTESVERDEFHSFAQHLLKHFHGLKAIGWVPRVRQAEHEAYEEAARQDGLQGFQFPERVAGKLAPAGAGSEYYPVYFIEPFEENMIAGGYDLASDPVRREALVQARDTGRMAATARIQLIEEDRKRWGILVLQPIYRNHTVPATVGERRAALLGYALAVFRMSDVLDQVITAQDAADLELSLTDLSARKGQGLLCLRRAGPLAQDSLTETEWRPPAGMGFVKNMALAGRAYELACAPSQAWLARHPVWQGGAALDAGLLLTALLAVYFSISAARVARLARLAVQFTAANQRLKTMTLTDDLTGLWNRRHFMASLEKELHATRPPEGHASVVVFGMDHFKVVNETHGNVCGDEVLAEVARVLWTRSRQEDVLARYGGEEFAVLMPGVSAEEAASAVESMRQGVEAYRLAAGGHVLQVTVSAGVASTAMPGAETAEGLLRLADEALFAAKAAGRNCVRTWDRICRDQQEEARRRNDMVENLQSEITALSLQSKETFVQSTNGLVQALEARDAYTKSHSLNVTRYAVAIAETMHLAAEDVAVIHSAAIVHDIGKIGVPDAILRKPGTLTSDEQRIMAEHVVIGARILGRMRFLEHEIPIVRHHHERWDGKGYPDGLAREAIPLGARILAVADTLDAITSARPYRVARPLWQAVRNLLEQSGSQFDPAVVDALVEWLVLIGHCVGGRDLETSDLAESPETSQAGMLVTALG